MTTYEFCKKKSSFPQHLIRQKRGIRAESIGVVRE
jgi:hypothetical protein